MRTWFLALGLICSISQLKAADVAPPVSPPSAGPPPTLTKAQMSADGKTLQLLRNVYAQVPQKVTKAIPETVIVVEGGKEVQKTEFRNVSETIMATFCKTVCEPVSLENVELRSAAGGRYKPEDLAKLVGTEPSPVIVLQRQLANVDGKLVAKTMDFDRSFLQIFKPDTLVLVLPPTGPPPGVMPPGAPMPIVAIPPPAPVVTTPPAPAVPAQ
jgi:hypothetical protein